MNTENGRAAGLHARLDLDRADRNIARLHRAAAAHGVRVRGHVKGHRTAELALRQVGAGAVGIAVTQFAQARAYVAAGVRDVVIAHPWPEPWRLRLAAGLARDCRLSVHVATGEAAAGLAAAARRAGTTVGVRIQLGTGLDATTTPDDQVLALARAVVSRPSLRLDGVTAYQALVTPRAARDPYGTGRDTAAYAVRVAGLLRGAGLPCPAVTVGGTPTASGALAVPGVTELCSGAYALYDTGLAAVGACAPEDVALTVAAHGAEDRRRLDALMARHPYPWQAPADHTRLASAAPPGTPLRPPHICSVTQGITSLTVHTGSGAHPLGTWRLINDQDGEPGTDEAERAQAAEAPTEARTAARTTATGGVRR
ncbi:alanine racemase [Streptomyces sp. NPDC004561]